MSRKRKHILVVEIECLDAQGPRQGQDLLHRWIEHYGHTTSSFGFDFIAVGWLTGPHTIKREIEDD